MIGLKRSNGGASQGNGYLRKHQLYPLQVASPPSPGLGLVVVIPCHAEPQRIPTLDSLWCCEPAGCDVEVLLVINASQAHDAATHARNRLTAESVRAWSRRHSRLALRCHVLEFPALPRKHAGVGLARKLGMDEAVARLEASRHADGVIACLDADCTCAPSYLRTLREHFDAHPETPACSIHFEHPLDACADARTRRAITDYELHLRYYRHALRYAGYPFAHYTVGSSMAVRSRDYQRQGGMNRRQAGEDFYFLNKLLPLGGFSELIATTVFPAARLSARTPFGTGRALRERAARGATTHMTYAPAVFCDLEAMLSRVDAFYTPAEAGALLLPEGVAAFLDAQGLPARFEEIRANTVSLAGFRKRFFRWFNPFRVMKLVRYLAGGVHGYVPVAQAAATLLAWQGVGLSEPRPDAHALLMLMRRMDREPGAL